MGTPCLNLAFSVAKIIIYSHLTKLFKQYHEMCIRQKKTAHLLPDTLLVLSLKCRVLDLDLNLNTAGELELHQGINSLSGRAVDVDETLVV